MERDTAQFWRVRLANAEQKRLSEAFRNVRERLGYPTAEAGFRAQQHLTMEQWKNRESGRTEWTVLELVHLAHDWQMAPAELFCLWAEEVDGSTFAPLSEKTGLTIAECRRRFEVRRGQLGLSFQQLYLLVLKDQVTL